MDKYIYKYFSVIRMGTVLLFQDYLTFEKQNVNIKVIVCTIVFSFLCAVLTVKMFQCFLFPWWLLPIVENVFGITLLRFGGGLKRRTPVLMLTRRVYLQFTRCIHKNVRGVLYTAEWGEKGSPGKSRGKARVLQIIHSHNHRLTLRHRHMGITRGENPGAL